MDDPMIVRTLERLERRKVHMLSLFDRVEREVRKGYHHQSEPGRLWLEQFCQGVGVQLCAGEFSIADSIGVNTDPRALATDHWVLSDRFVADYPPLDYVVTNYLECFSDPLRLLMDWHARMRKDGVLAIVARNADRYPELMGPLENHRRSSCFNINTVSMYLERAGFTVFHSEIPEKEIRVAARRR